MTIASFFTILPHLALLFLLLLLLSACTPGPRSTNYRTGNDGIVLSFERGTPPKEAYEEMRVPIAVRLWNKGAHPVNYTDIVFALKGDPFYVAITPDPLLEQARKGEIPNYQGEREDEFLILLGKSPGYENGRWLDLLPVAEFLPIKGLRESPETQLFASVCYPYETLFSAEVCVDANAFNGNVQRQVCSAQSLTASSQGAPVAVTLVENRPSPLRVAMEGGRGYVDIVQPVFLIHLQNVGDGTVLMPGPDSRRELDEACALRVPPERLNKVAVSASLSGLNLTCTPSEAILRDDKAFFSCVLPPGEVPLEMPNYLATLVVKARYLYQSRLSVDVAITRRPEGVASTDPTFRERDLDPGYIDGFPRCEFCSRSPGDSRCDWPEKTRGLVRDGASFGCTCGQEECLRLAPSGKCVYGSSWCPGTNQCCTKQ